MKKLTLLIFCLVLAVGSGWAGTGLITNPAQVNQDYVDWCVNFGCNTGSFPTPQPWISNGGLTGTVGLNGGFQNFFNYQQSVSWNGNFPANMGLIYNGRLFGNSDAGVVTTFDTGVYAAGAYVQSDYYGPFTAYVTLFDVNSLVISSFWANGYSNGAVGTALFIGAYDTVPFYAMQFDVIDQFGLNDVAIGTTWVNTTPEPGTLVLFGSSALGLAGYLRRRFL
jgi:hypothetical protein